MLTLSQYITPIYMLTHCLYYSFYQLSIYRHQICFPLSPGTGFQNGFLMCDLLGFLQLGIF